MQALILAGGLGTRLRPLNFNVPKPMADIGGCPFLEKLLLRLKAGGITDVVLLVGYRQEVIDRYFGDGKWLGLEIRYSREGKLLGTGGALKNAQKMVNAQFLILNGDTYCDIDLSDFIAFHKRKRAFLTIAVSKAISEGGKISLRRDGRVESFGKGGEYVNAGIYAANSKILNTIPANKKLSFESDVIPALLTGRVFAYPLSSGFLDIGTPQRYKRAKRLIK